VDPFGECRIDDDGEIKDCVVEIKDEEELTEEEKAEVDKMLGAIVEIGKKIQESGNDRQKDAWKRIVSITIRSRTHYTDDDGTEDTTIIGYNDNDNISYYNPAFLARWLPINRKEFAIHEILHSDRSIPNGQEPRVRSAGRQFINEHYDSLYESVVRGTH